MEVKRRMVVAKSRGEEEMGKCWSKDTKLYSCKIGAGGLLYNTGPTMNNTVLNT